MKSVLFCVGRHEHVWNIIYIITIWPFWQQTAVRSQNLYFGDHKTYNFERRLYPYLLSVSIQLKKRGREKIFWTFYMCVLIEHGLFCAPPPSGVRAPTPRNMEYKILVKGFIVFRFLFSTSKSKEEEFQTLYTFTLLDHF